jgi:SAM-dependent methyltransferase
VTTVGSGNQNADNGLAFDFGENWDQFSRAVLDEKRLAAATDSMAALVGADRLQGASVCDVGSGSGLFSLAAAKLGAARVLGFDVNPKAVAVGRRNLEQLAPEACASVTFVQGSALDPAFTGALGRFDMVYAWGSLHHTGDMWRAIENAAALTAPGGTLVLALYNAHWTSPIWTAIKVAYNYCPTFLRFIPNLIFGALIFLAAFAVTRRSPLTKERGMDFWYDVIDWLGGYPYEYVGVEEVERRMATAGFVMEKVVPPRVPTGCNEFVFRRAR